MSLPFIIGSAVIGGAISALSAADERREALRRADLITSDLRDAKVDPNEKRAMIDQIDDLYNTNLLGELNNSSIAIATIGASNPASARSEIAGKVLGQRSESILRTQQEIERYNRSIESEIVRVNAGIPESGSGISDFAIGAVATVPIGLGISDAVDLADENALKDQQLTSGLDDLYSKWGFKKDTAINTKVPSLSFKDYFYK